jgi:DNA-directed RNA polymerase I, II, and III subunit RPABC3
MADSQLYEDAFLVTTVDPGKYDRVARVAGTSQDKNTIITLDINTDLYPLAIGDHVQLLLASTLNLDGTKDDEEKGWREIKGPNLADAWDYVCHGKVYKFEEGDEGEVM